MKKLGRYAKSTRDLGTGFNLATGGFSRRAGGTLWPLFRRATSPSPPRLVSHSLMRLISDPDLGISNLGLLILT